MSVNRPESPYYTAKDILGDHPIYPGGFKRYRQDKTEHLRYALWHLWRTKGRCHNCDETILVNYRRIST